MLPTKVNKLFLLLSFFMGLVVILSNYLVQFPVEFYNLENILTYGAFSYPITFLITDLANRAFGKKIARQIVLIGFFVGIILTFFVSTNFDDIISIRIAIGSATAFLGSIIDTLLFFSIAFYNTDIPWLTLALGDLTVKLVVALIMLIPFRILIIKLNDLTDLKIKNLNY